MQENTDVFHHVQIQQNEQITKATDKPFTESPLCIKHLLSLQLIGISPRLDPSLMLTRCFV